ncbi:MAG TPA: DUF1993 domain-containing protein [Pseudolabrys sp.]|nr:DUF1993 domain-containing protein [Pseudolabrys sp.]
MPFTLYDVSIPVFVRAFGHLANILDKGAAYARDNGIDPAELIEARLAPNMRPLKSQIHLASDNAKGCAARLAGVEIPGYPDVEETFPDLKARIDKTLAFITGFSADTINASEGKTVVLKTRSRNIEFDAGVYLLTFALPNFFFHVTTAYDILRHKGVPLVKPDYLGH